MRALWVLVLFAACDQGMKPVPKELPRAPLQVPPSPLPPPSPKPPIPEDLAEYTKDLGAGSKLFAKLDTSQGSLTCELFFDKAPMTVANFVGLARGKKSWLDPSTGKVRREPFYDGLTFHRVIPGFMIQGGDPLGRGTGGPGYDFNDEIWPGAHLGPGALAMANAGLRGGHGTNGSQFFIMEQGDRPDLDTRHTTFGQCGTLEVIKAIAAVERGSTDKPVQPVKIHSVSIYRQ